MVVEGATIHAFTCRCCVTLARNARDQHDIETALLRPVRQSNTRRREVLPCRELEQLWRQLGEDV